MNSDDASFVRLPPSKSLAIRAILAAALADDSLGESSLDFSATDAELSFASSGAWGTSGGAHDNTSFLSGDIRAALNAASRLGASLRTEGKKLFLRGIGSTGVIHQIHQTTPEPVEISAGESALLLRTLIALSASLQGNFLIVREGSLIRRPIADLAAELQKYGVSVRPIDASKSILAVSGKLTERDLTLGRHLTSQNATGFLFALASQRKPSRLSVQCSVSRPYLEMSLGVLNRFGADIGHRFKNSPGHTQCHTPKSAREETHFDDVFLIPGKGLSPAAVSIEADWSAASFFLAFALAARLSGRLVLPGLFPNSLQGDSAVLRILRELGAHAEFEKTDDESPARLVFRAPQNFPRAFEADLTDTPDLLPPFAALALFCRGTSRLTGIARTAAKESDRPRALLDAIASLGGRAALSGDDALEISGSDRGRELQSAVVDAKSDHRIAMAAAVAGRAAGVSVRILGESAAAKSFPRFFSALESIPPS